MNITGILENGVLTIGMEGRIDTINAAQAEEEIQKLEAQDHGKVVLDAEKLEYISSAGLRVLLSAQKQMNRQGEVIVKHVNKTIMEVFEVTGFVDILNIQ